jgi:exodeoxyribonuclease V alpha subunit
VHGLGPKRTKRIADAWEEQKAIKEVMVFLSDVGVSTSLAVRIYKTYADSSIPVVRHEPYRLASEVWGIGFKTADTIAKAVGIPHDSPERIKAGPQYTLSQAADNGHCYLPEPDLVREAAKILEVEQEQIRPCLDVLVADEGVVREGVPANLDRTGSTVPAVYLVPFHRAERSLAAGLLDLLNSSDERLPAFAQLDWEKALGWLRNRTGQDLASGQQEAVKLALTSRVAVLTGGPGCGKSFTVRSVVELATAKKATIVLVAPTGRAAKRLSELTGHEAFTVHRLLELQPLAAYSIPRVRLTQIFRQAQQSGIVVNAHRINHGQHPQLTDFRDFYWFGCDPAEDSGLHPAEETAKLVADIVVRRIPAKFGLDPVRDVQVLTPMHRGPAGAGNLNALLQDALTPQRDGTAEKRYGDRVFRVGDKVTHLRNNYTKGKAGIFNGTVGTVTGLSLQEQTLTVLTDEDERIDYDFAELDELAHAYAITIHRSQGSEYPAVVIPLTTSSWRMLQRNLHYTGVTRAKQLIVLVRSRRALAQAVRTPGAGRRHTVLTHRLQPVE